MDVNEKSEPSSIVQLEPKIHPKTTPSVVRAAGERSLNNQSEDYTKSTKNDASKNIIGEEESSKNVQKTLSTKHQASSDEKTYETIEKKMKTKSTFNEAKYKEAPAHQKMPHFFLFATAICLL